jgi:hypothetical protein
MTMMKSLCLLLLTVSLACAGKWTLTWDANAPGDNVTQYEAYEVLGGLTNSLGVITTNRIVLNSVSPGQHTYQVVAISADGIRSDPSTNGVFVYPSSPKNIKPSP